MGADGARVWWTVGKEGAGRGGLTSKSSNRYPTFMIRCDVGNCHGENLGWAREYTHRQANAAAEDGWVRELQTQSGKDTSGNGVTGTRGIGGSVS